MLWLLLTHAGPVTRGGGKQTKEADDAGACLVTALFIMINELVFFVDYSAARSQYLFQLSTLKVAKLRLRA